MKKWIISVTVHGWEDDIDCLVFISDRFLTKDEIQIEYNTRFAGKNIGELAETGEVFFPLSTNDDENVLGIEKGEDGYYHEMDGGRSAWFRIEEINV